MVSFRPHLITIFLNSSDAISGHSLFILYLPGILPTTSRDSNKRKSGLMMSTTSTAAVCRVCYEGDERRSRLVSPCACRGTSRHIHEHCLRSWQKVAKSRSALVEHAFVCQICKTYYKHTTIFSTHFLQAIYFQYHQQLQLIVQTVRDLIRLCVRWIIHIIIMLACLPIKCVLYHIVKFLCIWVGNDNKLELDTFVLVADNGHDLHYKSFQHPFYGQRGNVGDLLITSRSTPPTSIFHKKVVLLVQHDSYKSVGIIINDLNHKISAATHQQLHQSRSEGSILHLRRNIPTSDFFSEEGKECPIVNEIGGQFHLEVCVILHTQQPPPFMLSKRLAMIGENCPIYVTQCLIDELGDTIARIEGNIDCCYCKDVQYLSETLVEKPPNYFTYADSVELPAAVVNAGGRSTNDNNSAALDHATCPSRNRCVQKHRHHLRVIRGLSVWQRGQLEGELRDGDWVSMPGSTSCLFTHNRASLWNALRNYYEVNHANIF
jgi:putative AlgH/UPF0301 family transcriptional regulator